MRNLDAAKAAFERWADTYEHGGNPERHIGAATLLEALHACGVSASVPSLWRYNHHPHQIVELICFAEGDATVAIVRDRDRNLAIARGLFLARFKPLVGDGARTDTARDAGKGDAL